MSEGKFQTNSQDQLVETTLGLVTAIEDGAPVSQRSLALRLGVALGLTNSLIKRCVRKGYLKVREAPRRRYVYYLTPHGFREKSRLTAQYLSASLHFFRRARSEYLEAAEHCDRRGWRRVALYGASELTEIAALSGLEVGLRFQAVIDPSRNQQRLVDLTVVRSLDEIGGPDAVDAVIITDTENPQRAFDEFSRRFGAERVLTPPLLHVARNRCIEAVGDAFDIALDSDEALQEEQRSG